MDLNSEERNRLKLMFNQTKNEIQRPSNIIDITDKINSKVLLVDGYNTFIRAWASIPSMNANGIHSGGIIGFLKSMGHAIKLLHPTRCVIVFDGIGGSYRRKKIYSDYKSHRSNKMRLNRIYEENISPEEEEDNYKVQLIRLQDYLKRLPVIILIIDHVEADDTIAYCALDYFKKSESIIMSSDKDFLQLVSDHVKVWSPTKKLLYGTAEVIRDYNIHPNNFVLFRSMDGDKSDNIDGIKGAGLKTIIKCFPFLSEEKIYTENDIVNYSMSNSKKYKIYSTILENQSTLNRNIQLMQLKDTLLTTVAQLKINDLLEIKNIPLMNRNVFMKMIADDKIMNNFPDHQSWLTECFSSMDTVLRTV